MSRSEDENRRLAALVDGGELAVNGSWDVSTDEAATERRAAWSTKSRLLQVLRRMEPAGFEPPDLLLAKQALSQLSYGPDPGSSLGTQPSKSKSRGGRCSNHSRSWSGASWRNSGVLSSTSSPSSSSGSSSYSSVSWSR